MQQRSGRSIRHLPVAAVKCTQRRGARLIAQRLNLIATRQQYATSSTVCQSGNTLSVKLSAYVFNSLRNLVPSYLMDMSANKSNLRRRRLCADRQRDALPSTILQPQLPAMSRVLCTKVTKQSISRLDIFIPLKRSRRALQDGSNRFLIG